MLLLGVMLPFVPAPSHAASVTPPLHVLGNRLVDTNGVPARLVGLNYGDHPANTPTFATGSPTTDASKIQHAGFNAVNLIEEWGSLETSSSNSSFTYNATSFLTLENRLAALTNQSLFVTVKIHADWDTSNDATNLQHFLGSQWCNSANDFLSKMSDSFYDPSKASSSSSGVSHLERLVKEVSGNISSDPSINGAYVLGYDLLNQPTRGYNSVTSNPCHQVASNSTVPGWWHTDVAGIISSIRNIPDNRVINVELAPAFRYQDEYNNFTQWSDPNVQVSYHWYVGECGPSDRSQGCNPPSSHPSGSWKACNATPSDLAGLWGNKNAVDIPSYCHNTAGHYIAQLQSKYPNQAISIGEFGDIYDNSPGDGNETWILHSIGVFLNNTVTSYYYYASGTCQGSSSSCTWTSLSTNTANDMATPLWPLGSCLAVTSYNSTVVSLSWSPAKAFSGSYGVANYAVYQNRSPRVTLGNVTSYTASSLTPQTTYLFQVQAGFKSGSASNDTITGPSLTVTTTGTNDFNMTASPACLTVVPGPYQSGTAVSSVNLGTVGSFAGNVAISATVAPVVVNGPNVTVSPSTVTLSSGGRGSSVLTVSTTMSTPAESNYSIILTGRNNSLVHTVTIPLIVPEDYGLCCQGRQTLLPGSSLLTSISVWSLGGFGDSVGTNVTLSQTVSPVTASPPISTFSSNIATLHSDKAVSIIWNITVTSSTTLANYTYTVTGTSGFNSHSYNYIINATSGGGGSVGAGTLITLADGSQMPVQNLHVGMQLLSYDMSRNQYTTSTLTRFYSVVTYNQMVISTSTGAPLIVDQNPVQKILVMLPDGTQTMMSVTSLQVGYCLFDALSQTWTPITRLQYQNGGRHTMYDIYDSAPGNYIANGYLADPKQGPGS